VLWLDIVSRITHISTAIVLIGGTAFTLLVLIPATRLMSAESHDLLAAEIKNRWKRFVHIGVTLFLVSGFYNYIRAMGLHKGDGLYHGLMGAKMLMAFVVFFLAAALVGRSSALQRIRTNRVFWLRVMVSMATIIVIISGYLKVRGTNVPMSNTPVITATE